MKVGVEIDEVVFPFLKGFCEFYNFNYGKNISLEGFKEYYDSEFFEQDLIEGVEEFFKEDVNG